MKARFNQLIQIILSDWFFFMILVSQTLLYKSIFVIYHMGATLCCSAVNSPWISDSLKIQYGQDDHETNVFHNDNIYSKDQSINPLLKKFQQGLKKSQKMYKDPNFKTLPVSLNKLDDNQQLKCKFHRPYHFLDDKQLKDSKKYKIFDFNNSKCNDIIIKNEGFQYFSAFLCFLADHRFLINSIIQTDTNTYGIHIIKMYIKGVQQLIAIDDYILCHKEKPSFVQPALNTYMWTCLLQKAWLKLKGQFQTKLCSSSVAQVISTFLLYPYIIYTQEPSTDTFSSQVKKRIISDHGQGVIFTSKDTPLHKIGLSGKKSYYLIFQFNYQGKQLYYLRNPYIEFDFRGVYKIIPQEIEAIIQTYTKQSNISPGNFLINESELDEQIQEILIINYNKNSSEVSQQTFQLDLNIDFYVDFILEKEEWVSITFFQSEMQGNISFCQLSYQIIQVLEQQDQPNFYRLISGDKNLSGCFGVHSTSLLNQTFQTLSSGRYIIRLKKMFPSSYLIETQYKLLDRIVVTASSKVSIDYKHFSECKIQFQNFLIQRGKEQLQGALGLSKFSNPSIDHIHFWMGDLAIIYIRKKAKGLDQIKVELTFFEKKNLECINYNLTGQFSVIVLEKHETVIIFEKIDLTSATILGKYSIDTF